METDLTFPFYDEPPSGIPLEEWLEQQVEGVTPAERDRVSKHRAGRHKPMGQRERRWRIRTKRLRISEYLDAKVMREAVDGPGA